MEEKESLKQKILAQLEIWHNEIDAIKESLKNNADLDNDSIQERDHQADQLKNQIEEEKVKLNNIDQDSDNTWETIKDGVEASWELLKIGIDSAIDKLTQNK